MQTTRTSRSQEALRRIGLTAAVLASTLAFPAVVAAATPPTLSGEFLTEQSLTVDPAGPKWQGTCDPTGESTFEFSSSGPASGPYPGTYTEQGTAKIGPQDGPDRGFLPDPTVPGFNLVSSRGFATGPVVSIQAQFHISSPAGDITGTKTTNASTADGTGVCQDVVNGLFPEVGYVGNGFIRDMSTTVDYDATIHTPSGEYRDTGSSFLLGQELIALRNAGGGSLGGQFLETFTSGLATPTPLLPTSGDDCMKNGWRRYGVFKNQGDCVSYVATDGKNPPAGA